MEAADIVAALIGNRKIKGPRRRAMRQGLKRLCAIVARRWRYERHEQLGENRNERTEN